jgi:enamine deaminase RidA (YjgF/YER057c/UK114 family)
MNEVWDAWIKPGTAPARTTVQALMYSPDVRVEITVVAAMPDLAGPVL